MITTTTAKTTPSTTIAIIIIIITTIIIIVDLGREISPITNDNRETSFLIQRLSIAIQRGNEICFTNRFDSVIQNGTD